MFHARINGVEYYHVTDHALHIPQKFKQSSSADQQLKLGGAPTPFQLRSSFSETNTLASVSAMKQRGITDQQTEIAFASKTTTSATGWQLKAPEMA
ncbi:hypothetical protein Nepgr_018897 [Nepenthes gracilis]|uniref:Uncharacterized protein n=1 Tax=Nepenthes gracilis TaxID=150966 RepID=A0AAD3XUS3_NEPGR|nr:hypothetical protein Nepgr_018897 [Nepenthes gracilis]